MMIDERWALIGREDVKLITQLGAGILARWRLYLSNGLREATEGELENCLELR